MWFWKFGTCKLLDSVSLPQLHSCWLNMIIPGAEIHDLIITVDVEKIINIFLSLSQIPDLLGLSKDRQILTLYSWVICKEH